MFNKNSDLVDSYLFHWLNNASKVGERLIKKGISTDFSQSFIKGLSTGHIIVDLARLIPKVEGEDADPNAALGYCTSLAENILQYDVPASSRNELFRSF